MFYHLRLITKKVGLADRLAEALDSYLANLPEISGRSRFVPVPQARTGNKPGNGKMWCLRYLVVGLAVSQVAQ